MAGFREVLPDIVARIRVQGDPVGYNQQVGLARAGGRRIGMALTAGVALGVAGVGVVVKKSLASATEEASNLVEAVGKVSAVYGEAATAGMRAWAKQQAAIGISESAALDAVGTYGNLFTAFGLGRKEAAKYGKNLTVLAADLASFNDVAPDEAIIALRSAMSGETEPMKRFGVALSVAAVQAKALEMGLVKSAVDTNKVAGARLKLAEAQQALNEVERSGGVDVEARRDAEIALMKARERQAAVNDSFKASEGDRLAAARAVEKAERKLAELSKGSTTSSLKRAKAKQRVADAEAALAKAMKGSRVELTQAQRAQATYALLMEQTANAHGYAEKEAESSLSGQKNILKASRDNMLAALGEPLLPAQIEFIKSLNADVLPAVQRVFKKNEDNIKRHAGRVGDLGADMAKAFGGWLEHDAADDFDRIKTAVVDMKPAAEGVRDAVEGTWRAIEPAATEVWDGLNNALGVTRDLMGEVGPLALDAITAFNDSPKWVKTAVGVAVAGGFTAAKINALRRAIGGGGGGPRSGPLGLGRQRGSSPKNPLWVASVTGGVGPGGGGGVVPGGGRGGKHRGVGRVARAAGAARAYASTAALPAAFTAGFLNNVISQDGASSEARRVIKDNTEILDRLQASAIGKYADDLGVDLERLAESMATDGDRAYFLEVSQQLKESNRGLKNKIKGAAGYIPLIDTEAEKSLDALEDIVEIYNGVGKMAERHKRQAEATFHLFDSLDAMAQIGESILAMPGLGGGNNGRPRSQQPRTPAPMIPQQTYNNFNFHGDIKTAQSFPDVARDARTLAARRSLIR